MTTETVPFYRSKTILGIVTLFVSAAIHRYAPNAVGGAEITAALTLIGEAVGAVLAIIGRVVAKRRLTMGG